MKYFQSNTCNSVENMITQEELEDTKG